MNDLLQLAEALLARFGPIMVECGKCKGKGQDSLWFCDCQNTNKPMTKRGSGARPITPTELATPDGDRPNAAVDRLCWAGDFATLLHTKHGWRGHGWAGDHLMDGPWCATRHHAQLAAAAGEDER